MSYLGENARNVHCIVYNASTLTSTPFEIFNNHHSFAYTFDQLVSQIFARDLLKWERLLHIVKCRYTSLRSVNFQALNELYNKY